MHKVYPSNIHFNILERLVGRIPVRQPKSRNFLHFLFSSIKQHRAQKIFKNLQ